MITFPMKFRHLKKLSAMLIIFLITALYACDSGNLNESDTEWLRLKILDIYDYPQDYLQSPWQHTITACSPNWFSNNCQHVQYFFNHTDLQYIGVTEGSIVRVEVSIMRLLPDPAPLFVRNWELIE